MTNPLKTTNHYTIPARPSLLNKKTASGLFFLGAFLWSLAQAGFWQRDLINEGGWVIAWRFIAAITHPELSWDFIMLTLESMLITWVYAVCGTVFSLILGAVGGLLSSEVWWKAVFSGKNRAIWGLPVYRLPWLLIRGLLAIPRAIHEIIWGLFFINIIGLNPLTAILAIGIAFGAIQAKVFSEILDETPQQPFIILQNSGATPLKAFFYSLLPQAFPNLLSYAFYRFECAIRAAIVLGIIGAGGLGYQILLSLQTLRYEEMWTLMIALMLLSGLSDLWSSMLRYHIKAANQIDIHIGTVNKTNTPLFYYESGFVKFSIVIIILMVPFSFWYVDADFAKLFSPKTAQLFINLAQDAYPPSINPEDLAILVKVAGQTLAMSILAMLASGLGGILLSFPAANNFMLPGGILDTGGNRSRHLWLGTIILLITRGFLLFTRAIPAPIWALLALFVFFPGILPGAIGLGIYNLGVLGRLMAEANENLDTRPLRVLKAQGASGAQVFFYGVLPQSLTKFIAYMLYRWEVCIRATVLVGLVGAGGLGRLLTEQLSSFDYKSLVTTLICFMLLTFMVDLISSTIRRMIR